MRGESEQQLGFSLVRPDLLVPEDHPIRTIKVLADAELRRLSAGLRPDVFADGAAVDSAGAFAEGMPADVPVQHPQ